MISPEADLLMKVGFHFEEEWMEIVERKLAEVSVAGVAYWG